MVGHGGSGAAISLPGPELLPGRIEFAAVPAAAGVARRWVAGQLARTYPAELVDTAMLVVSELVTNAVRASAAAATESGRQDPGRIEVAIADTGDMLRIEVTDAACGSLPVSSGHADAGAESGRGLQVVSMLSRRWGCRPAARGKAVWCDLPVAGLALAPGLPGEPAAARQRRRNSPVAVGADITSRNGT